MTADNLKLVQEQIVKHGGEFSRKFDIPSDMSEEQRKENQLFRF